MNDSESNLNPVGRPPIDGQAADGHIHLRVTMARKNAYVRAAKSHPDKPQKLTEWMFDQLDYAKNMNNIIKTTVDPKEIRAKYQRITVVDGGEFDTTAETEIINEDIDTKTGIFTMQIGLRYPRRSTRNTISLAVMVNKEGKSMAIPPLDYIMSQEDFDKMIKGEKFNVPARH